MFCKKAVLKNFISLTEKLFRWSPLFCKVTVPQSFTKYLRQTLVFMWNRALREKFNWGTTGKVQFLCFRSFLLLQWSLPIADIPNSGHFLNSRQNVQSNVTVYVKLLSSSGHLSITDKVFKTRKYPLFRGFTVFTKFSFREED